MAQQYSKEDKEAFKKKDKLNARQSALKAASVNNEGSQKPTNEILDEAKVYYDWLYPDKDKLPINSSGVWDKIAEGLNLAIPNKENVKVLNLLLSEYKKLNKASANPSALATEILQHIMSQFGKYPTVEGSVGLILDGLLQTKG
jgi:hypothetical protein